MNRLGLILLALCACSPPKPTPNAAPIPAPTPPPAESPQVSSPLSYVMKVQDAPPAEDSLPMVILMHGLGDRPERFLRLMEDYPRDVRIISVQAPLPYRQGYSWFTGRSASLAPETLAAEMKARADEVNQLTEELIAKFPTEVKPAVTGFSQGGMMSFALALTHPESFSEIVALAGYVPPPMLSSLPPAPSTFITALHGTDDAVLPVTNVQEAVGALTSAGYTVRLSTYPGVGHSVPPQMRTELFEALDRAFSPPTPSQP